MSVASRRGVAVVTAPERAVFAPTVEGLVRGLGSKLSEPTLAELRKLGLDLDQPLKPGYPALMWHQALKLIAAEVYPGLTAEEAHFQMGARTVSGLDETLVGKAMLGLIRLIGPRRALQRLPTSSKVGTNFMTVTLTEQGPTDVLLTSHPFMGYAEVMQGSVHSILTVAGAKDPRVEIVEYDRGTERMTLRVQWSA
jgi:uncharacterized protein (TIGR02265 family)